MTVASEGEDVADQEAARETELVARGADACTALATALVPTGFGAAAACIAVVAAVLLAGAALPPSLAVVGDVVRGNEAMVAATGLIGLLNFVGSMIAPWVFGAPPGRVRHAAWRLRLRSRLPHAGRLLRGRARPKRE